MSYESKMFFKIFCISLLFNLCSLVSSNDQVPVLLWSPSTSLPTVPGLRRVPAFQFSQLLHDVTAKEHPIIAVFLEEELSVEDFNLRDLKGNSVFSSLHDLTDGQNVEFSPSVIHPMKAIRLLKDHGYDWKHYRGDGTFDFDSPTILLIPLEADEIESDRSNTLQSHDKKISNIYQKLVDKYPNLLSIYTSKRSRWAEEVKRNIRVRREDSPTEGEGGYDGLVMAKDGCVILAKTIMYTRPNSAEILNFTSVEDVVLRNETDNYLLDVTLKEKPESVAVKFTFNISSPDSYQWQLQSVTVEDAVLINRDYIGAPRDWCYACPQSLKFKLQSDPTADVPLLNITGLQMQPSINTETFKFGQPIYCTPYFSIAIWMGIVVVGLFVLIMTWGIIMLMDINTNDRFDDPKGKTITISATD